MTADLPAIVAAHIDAVNAHDADAVVATFADDAYVNDNRREIAGIAAIRGFVQKELTGDRVSMDVREVVSHYGEVIVRAAYDGDYDKTGLPEDLVLTNYFRVQDGKIVSLIIVFNQPSPY